MALTEPSLFWLSVAVTLVGIVMAIANFHRWSQRPTGKALGGVSLCLSGSSQFVGGGNKHLGDARTSAGAAASACIEPRAPLHERLFPL
jgi:hypothetical protein